MASDSKRYFKKRESPTSKELESELDLPVFESTRNQFPHIFRFITALTGSSTRLLWSVFNTILYSCIVFLLLVQLPILFPRPLRATSFSDDLINSPSSYRSHLLYLESLAVKNRLEEAQHESDFLRIAQETLHPTAEELSTLVNLDTTISARKIIFHTTIDEYNHWNDVLKGHPDYRDVLYRVGQRSYMLFDDSNARNYIQKGVDLDPQFEQGKRVLQRLEE